MIDYDPHNWYDHLFDVRGSMFREIIGRVLSCVVWAVILTVWDMVLLPRWGMNDLPLSIPVGAHALIGTALGLLLVFRTNSSYDRF